MMNLGNTIRKLRTESHLSQEQFAEIFGISQQSVQKWEIGDTIPELSKLVRLSKYFGISLDALILENDNRIVDNMKGRNQIKPQYANIHDWEFYSSNLVTEYRQSIEEGLDIQAYKDVFYAVSRLPKGEVQKKFGDVLFEVVTKAETSEKYPYIEPSDYEQIKTLRRPYEYKKKDGVDLESRIQGAWNGRVCGCLLGKTVEGIRTDELIPFLKETGNYPMYRYILSSDLEKVDLSKYKFPFESRVYADNIHEMPEDDDTNYTVLYQEVVRRYGKDFTSYDVLSAWTELQAKDAYCTAERVAFCNFINGYMPPDSSLYKNPYREWIGAQIRGDYFGYINPGKPEAAAEMAWRDASVSHVKNGIYGEMFVAAMLAVAAETNDMEDIVLGGLAEIPYTSRLYEAIRLVLDNYKSGMNQKECFRLIHEKYNEHECHGWCHVIPNAMIVVASLLYGNGDYGKSVCMSVETGFDTDCNGATVGSIIGMANGMQAIPSVWTEPIHDMVQTNIIGIGTVKISERVALTLQHINHTVV